MILKNSTSLKNLYDDFFLIKNNKDFFIFSEKLNILIKIKKNGYIPKSGFMLIDSIKDIDFSKKNILDIGCGETGIITHYLYLKNPKNITGIDIDKKAIKHVSKSSNFSKKIKWIPGDFKILRGKKFDVVVSNPPQMPIFNFSLQKEKNYHDSSGSTGRETIIDILKLAPHLLRKNGNIFMLIFDFLGIEESFNNNPSIKNIAKNLGISCNIIDSHKKIVNKNGKTFENIEFIKSIYPMYRFKTNEQGELYFNVYTVQFKIKAH